jgi:glycogen operon protein
VDWTFDGSRRELLEFARAVFAIRRANPVLRRRRFFRGATVAEGVKDVTWLRPDGREMAAGDWNDAGGHVLGMLIHGWATDERDERGRRVRGDTLLFLVNGGPRSRAFTLPRLEGPGAWQHEIDTARPGSRTVRNGAINLVAHSLVLLRHGEP